MTNDAYRGIVRGKIVELSNDPGLEQGQHVEVVLRPVDGRETKGSAAGTLSDVPDLDKSLEEIQRYRKLAEYRTDTL